MCRARCITTASKQLRTAAVCGLLLAVTWACGGRPEETPAPPPVVTVQPAAERTVELRLPFLGTVESSRMVGLVALVEGRVLRVAVGDGAEVRPGELVFDLGGPRVEARRRALEAALQAATDRNRAALAGLEQARRRAGAHLATPGELPRAEAEAADAAAALAAATEALDRFQAALTVAAPVSGRFTGRRVSPGQDVLPGEVLGEILAAGAVRITAEAVPRPGLEPAPGQPAAVEGEGGASLPATVQAVQPEAGAAGTVRVWLVGDALAGLAPGTAVRGGIVAARHEHAVTVPPSAVVTTRDGRTVVYTGSAPPYRRTEVTLGERGPDWVEIVRGLEPGTPVVVRGAYELYWSEFATEFKVEE